MIRFKKKRKTQHELFYRNFPVWLQQRGQEVRKTYPEVLWAWLVLPLHHNPCPKHSKSRRSCLLDMQPECQLPVTLTCLQPLVVLPLSVLYLYSRITWNIDSGVLINWTCSKYSSYEVQRCFSCRTGAVYLCRELLALSQHFESFPRDISYNFSKSRNSGKRHKQYFLKLGELPFKLI